MTSAAIDINESPSNNIANLATYQPPRGPSDSWIENVMDSLANNGIKKKLSNAARVHPCIIEGQRVLVYQRGLKQKEPEVFAELIDFAQTNSFALKEDQRDIHQKDIPFERRKAKTTSMVLLAGGLFLHGAAQAGAIPKNQLDDLINKDYVYPMVQVVDESQSKHRSYLAHDGKVSPVTKSNEIENILSIASKVKSQGTMTGVSTHNIKMPEEYIGGFINRYDYQFDNSFYGNNYSYYEGDGFGALAYYNGGNVLVDVLIGNDAQINQIIGGPYDQVLYDNHQMQLFTYRSKKNQQTSFLKATYSMGITTLISL